LRGCSPSRRRLARKRGAQAFFVKIHPAGGAMISLPSKSPDEVFAFIAEGRGRELDKLKSMLLLFSVLLFVLF